MRVLKSRQQISSSREALRKKGASVAEGAFARLKRKVGLADGIAVGEIGKSWDVLQTVQFLETHVEKDRPLLDIGAYASEIVLSLDKLGFSSVHGIDLDPEVSRMPAADRIRYSVGDFMAMPFPDAAFEAVTSISVIEHGYDPDRLLAEVSRVLRPGGFFVFSFDYWPEKINTDGIKFFGMSWHIFSEQEIRDFVARAARFGFETVEPGDYTAGTPLIQCGGKSYTFGWMALRKSQPA
jgi:SAM-dependent methyltransferase